MTYIVKTMRNGDIGVYDTERSSFPIETAELRAAGIGRIGWMRGKDGEAEANRIADTLNAFHNLGDLADKAGKAMAKAGKAASDAEQALIDAGNRLIEDQAVSA